MTLLALVLTGVVIIGIVGFCAAIVASIYDNHEPLAQFLSWILCTIIVTALYAGIISLFWLVAKGVIS